MIRRVFHRIHIVFFLFSFLLPAYATHQKAAEMFVEHVTGYTYRAILLTYTFTQSPVDRPEIEINWGDGTSSIVSRLREEYLENDTKLNYYTAEHTYSGPGSYVLFMEDPNRNSGVINIPNSVLTSMYISTSILVSPWLGDGNDSPVTTRRPVDDNACLGQPYIHNPAVYDPNGDSISYKLIPCRTANGEDVPGFTYPAASDTFYIDAYRGDLVWNTPMAQGEYNVAMSIEEWRNGLKIGDVTRDMQIIVRACDNNPPYMDCQESFCIEAGQELQFPVWIRDQNDNYLSLEADGEIMNGNYSAGLNRLVNEPDSAVFGFFWKTSLKDSRKNPYMLYLRASDDGDPSLSSAKTVIIEVLAPAPVFVAADAVEEGIGLQWYGTQSPHASGYELYRRDFLQDELVYDSCQRGIADSAYRKIASLSIADTSYLDKDVSEGRLYCYRLVAVFPDGSASKPSDPICGQTLNESPLITKVSVENTDMYEGVIAVSWVRPEIIDTQAIDTLRYRLWAGSSPDSLLQVAEIPFDSVVFFSDSGRNTERVRYYYRVELGEAASETVPSMYLTSLGRTRRIELFWNADFPWRVLYYQVFRYEDSSGDFRLMGSVRQPGFVDVEVETRRDYRYYVQAVGMYGTERLPDTLYSKSNETICQALEGEPCKPYLFLVGSDCDPLRNELIWDFDSTYNPFGSLTDTGSMTEEEKADCESSVSYFEVFRKRGSETQFELIAAVDGKEYEDVEPGSLFCSYMVRGVSDRDQVSDYSNELVVENWRCFEFDLPNVFTPNGDGTNDTWSARKASDIDKFSIIVVNRWGVRVFESKDPDFSWNGKLNNKGSDCPGGPYFYMAEFEAYAEGRSFKKVQSGSVTVLR